MLRWGKVERLFFSKARGNIMNDFEKQIRVKRVIMEAKQQGGLDNEKI